VKQAVDLGATDPSSVISVTVWLKLHNENQLDQLVKQRYENGSPAFHRWITQAEFNSSFGPTAEGLKSVQKFLTAHGLTVVDIAENNLYVKAQATVANVQETFHVQIDNLKFHGATYRSNMTDPSVNHISGAHIAAISGMDDFGFQPNVTQPTDADGHPASFIPLSKVSPGGVFFEGQCFAVFRFGPSPGPGTRPHIQGTATGQTLRIANSVTFPLADTLLKSFRRPIT
jgi:subtilase family serine protease